MFQKRKNKDQKQTKIKKNGIHNNREVMVVTYFFVALFLGMMGYVTYFTATSRQDMINNNYNSRQEILLSQNYRGTIYSADGEILAETVIDANGNETRVYPYENIFSHVVGYSTKGKTGIEAQGNYYLINSNLPLSDKIVNELAGKKNPGDDVYSTLDANLQKIASKFLGIYDGAIIVTEPSTGRILAMVSKPDYNPNDIVQIWEDLVVDEDSTVLLNRATQGLYPPGSTFKIITALEYMRENASTYQNYSYSCNGYYKNDDNRINCFHGTKHGVVDFNQSFAKSCNASFSNMGITLDKATFSKTLDDLLFNESLPSKFNYAKSSIDINENLTVEEMLQTVIGQGKTQVTPLHMNLITCAIANKGILMQPYAIDSIKTNAGVSVKKFHSSAYGRLMTQEEALALTELMEEVVESGTGTRLSGLSYTAAGKTGSAEYGNVKGESHAWFTGFAPVEDPQICVTIIIEGAGSGGDYAVPIAKRIFDAYFEGN